MLKISMLLALLAAPFWESKPPRDWTAEELSQMLRDSPWAQTIANVPPPVEVFLASALPIREAEAEMARRRKRKPGEEVSPEFADFLREDRGKSLVLAVSYPNWMALSDAAESRRMEEESVMKVGRKKYKMTGHFPPTPSDPYLRLIFPREIGPKDKAFTFDLYLPGISNGYREVEFRVKELLYRGKTEI